MFSIGKSLSLVRKEAFNFNNIKGQVYWYTVLSTIHLDKGYLQASGYTSLLVK